MQHLLKMAISSKSIWMVLLIGLFQSGCTCPTERIHPQFPSYRHTMGVILVLMPEIGIFEQMPNGSRLFQETQSRNAQRVAQQSIAGQLLKRHFKVQSADAGVMQLAEVQSLTALFRSVNRSIQLHTFGPQIYPAKVKTFDYQLGSVADILKTNGADGLVLALGHQTGSDQPARNWLSIAIVEPEGRIIWYGIQGDHQKFDLHSADGVEALVAYTMANFWESGS